MTTEQPDRLHQARSKCPFTIHLADGTQHRVVSPEFLSRTQCERTIAVSAGRDAVAIIDLLLVTRSRRATARRRRAA